MYHIQTLNNISEKGLKLLPKERFQVSDSLEDPDGILVRSAKMHEMEFGQNLRGIARAGAGVNNIPVEKCSEQGIVVFNTPGANANSVKELVISGMLLSSRRIHQGLNWTQTLAGKGEEVAKLVEKEKKQFAGPEIAGKTLGVMGLGAIGVMVCNAACALGMDVIGFDPYISVESAWGLDQSVRRATTEEGILGEADYVTLHVPLNDATTGMINADSLKKAKPGLRLLNFARGPLVNNKDVLDAIDKGIVAAYVTDFPEDELLGNDRVLPVPHLGASTPEAEENCAVMAARQLADFLETGNIRNSVNFPECHMEPTSSHRLVVTNRNIPNMVGQITTVLAGENINIQDLLNRHHDSLAYNIIDLDGPVSGESIDRINQIDGVIRTTTFEFDSAKS
jgi:D-3-phosphoglycerate dehydrogenase